MSFILFNLFLTTVESGSCEYKSALISSVVIAHITLASSAGVSPSRTPEKIIWVIVVVIVVQQIDGNIIYPNIIGKTLNIHPLTIIILLLAAGNIAGIAGMILCIPFYAVVKTIASYFFSIWRLRRRDNY